MSYSEKLRAAAIVGIVFISCGLFAKSKDFVRPTARAANTYAAHDEHTTEKAAIAVDPYDTPEKAKIFSIDFLERGILPVFFIVTNEGDQPISMIRLDVTLVTKNRSKLTPLGSDDLYRRLSNPQANTTPSPFPIPHKKVKGAVSQRDMDEISSAQFGAKAVEPHSTQSGFLFFDVGGISDPLAGAHVYVSGVDNASGSELMYFDIPVTK